MPRRRFAGLDVAIVVALTVLVFGYQVSLEPGARMLFDVRFGAVPVDLWSAWTDFRAEGLSAGVLDAAMPLVTANFLHASVAHVGVNMLFLWVFGNVVSRAAGRALFVSLYILSGVVAVLVHVRTNPGSEVPMVGASGAIAGLEGAYFVFVFRWEVAHPTVWPLDGPQPPARLALVALLGFALDARSFFGGVTDHVAYGAHVGGFLGGALLAMLVASVYRPRFRA